MVMSATSAAMLRRWCFLALAARCYGITRARQSITCRGGSKKDASKDDAFGLLDRNDDGSISREELGATMRSLGDAPSEAELSEVMGSLDGDGDGSVSRDEWAAADGDDDRAELVPRAKMKVAEVLEEDLDGEVYLSFQIDPARVLAAAASAASRIVRSLWGWCFGGGSNIPVVEEEDGGVAAAWPDAVASPARAAKRALERGAFVLVAGAPADGAAAVAALLGDDALGQSLRDQKVVVLDAASSDAAYARGAALASAALPVGLPKRASFLALAAPAAPDFRKLEALAVYRPTSVSSPLAVAAWLARHADAHAGALAAVVKAKAELDLEREQRGAIAAAVADDRRAAAAAAATQAAKAAKAAEAAEAALEAERKAEGDARRRADLAAALPPEADGAGVAVKLRCPGGATKTRRFAPDATTRHLLDWADVCGVDLDRYAVRKAAGDKRALDDPELPLGDAVGARALLECVDK